MSDADTTAIDPHHDPRDHAPGSRDAGADPRDPAASKAQEVDPAAGTSDDPRVDATPDGRQSPTP